VCDTIPPPTFSSKRRVYASESAGPFFDIRQHVSTAEVLSSSSKTFELPEQPHSPLSGFQSISLAHCKSISKK
jgi:hypothetical protein